MLNVRSWEGMDANIVIKKNHNGTVLSLPVNTFSLSSRNYQPLRNKGGPTWQWNSRHPRDIEGNESQIVDIFASFSLQLTNEFDHFPFLLAARRNLEILPLEESPSSVEFSAHSSHSKPLLLIVAEQL